MSRPLPSFDLVVATVGRTEELGRLFASLREQTHAAFRVLLVDQNPDDWLDAVIAASGIEVVRLRSEPGLSRARNAALGRVEADVVAFPDDDCAYPPELLERVGRRFVDDASLDGLTGRVADSSGRSSASWESDPARLDRDNLWNRANSAATFLRRELVLRVGPFDEELGLGSGRPWQSGEEIDYLLRALAAGARVEYDPSLVVEHAVVPDDPSVGARDGATVGYLLRKHDYPARTRARMLVRPLGGVLVSLARRDRDRARYYTATLRGRVRSLRR